MSAGPLSIATAFYYLDVSVMTRVAAVLGRGDDEARFSRLAARIKQAFNERFYDPVCGYYDGGIQSAQAWPLVFGLVPDNEVDKVTGFLVGLVGDRQRRLTTGYTSTKFAIQALSRAGRNDIVWQRAIATDYPSWGYMLRRHRTTSCERWDGERGSFNHAPLGAAIDEWFYADLAGIRPDINAPGYERIVFKPYIPPGLTWARASLQTMRGRVATGWEQHDGQVRLEITVPANSRGVVHIPCGNAITEGGRPAAEADGITEIGTAETETIFEIGSGEYSFVFPAPA